MRPRASCPRRDRSRVTAEVDEVRPLFVRENTDGAGLHLAREGPKIAKGGASPKAAAVGRQKTYMEGKDYTAVVYDRALIKAGNRIAGPAIVMEMDSTSVILPKHHGRVDALGNILIFPDSFRPKPAARARN